jgi:hypothetical protein
MKNFKFNLNSLEEMYSYGLVDPVDSIFEFMKEKIYLGHPIILEKQINTTEGSEMICFHDISDLKRFYNMFIKKNHLPLNVLLEQRKTWNSRMIES